MITMRASGVVSIAFAKTGLVLLCTVFSEMFPPGRDDLVEMLKDDLPVLVHRLVALVRIEIQPPALYIENSGHPSAIPL